MLLSTLLLRPRGSPAERGGWGLRRVGRGESESEGGGQGDRRLHRPHEASVSEAHEPCLKHLTYSVVVDKE